METGANSMIKTCVVLDGKIINVGDWDFQYLQVEINPPEYDEDGKVIKDAVYEQVAQNPLPKGAVIEERDFGYMEEHGWREVGWKPPLSTEEQLRLEMARSNAEMFETMLALMGGV